MVLRFCCKNHKIQNLNVETNYFNGQTVREKKLANSMHVIFWPYIKILLANFKENSGLWWPQGAVTCPLLDRGKRPLVIFEVFRACLREFLLLFHELFFDSKILSSSCSRHQKFDYECSSYTGNEAQSPNFYHFQTIFGIFGAVRLGRSPQPREIFFTKN